LRVTKAWPSGHDRRVGVLRAGLLCTLGLTACNGGLGGSATQGGSSATADGDSEATGTIYDIPVEDVPGNCEPGEEDEYDFVNLWVANSPIGMVSKIDTRQRKEVGRYQTSPDTEGDPSRTSVNMLGDMVVVNRAGSITKIIGRTETCPDTNGQNGIQTSTGADDVFAWGEDECVAWHTQLTDSTGLENRWGPRPVAWEGSDVNEICDANPRVWVGFYDFHDNEGEFRRLDGQTGEVVDDVAVPWSGETWGPYGGAVNKEGDFWVIGWGTGPLVRIDADGATYDVHQIPEHWSGMTRTYGIALDAYGRPWISSMGSVLNYDPETDEFTWLDTGNESMRGMGADRNGHIWIAVEEDAFEECGLAIIDYESMSVLAAHKNLDGCSEPVGVSVDADGWVWVVDQGAQLAFRVDPETWVEEKLIGGLVLPYTYSDMTGAGLNLVIRPEEG
jgi:hypothetical protein